MMASKIKIVIPARFGSTRLPGKPLLSLGGKPVLLHVFNRCIDAGFSQADIVVATDDARIVAVMQQSGVNVCMTSIEHESGTDRIYQVAHQLGFSPDTIVLNVQGDEPLIPSELIRAVADLAIHHSEFDIVTAVTRFSDWEDFSDPNHVKAILTAQQQALYFTRAMAPYHRDNPRCYEMARRHIGIYAYRVDVLNRICDLPASNLERYEKLEQLRALEAGMSIGAVVFEGNVPHGVDTEDDYQKLVLEFDK